MDRGISLYFLQSYPSLPDLDSDIKDLAEVEFDTSLSFGTMRKTTLIMMEQIQEELKKLTSMGNNSVTDDESMSKAKMLT